MHRSTTRQGCGWRRGWEIFGLFAAFSLMLAPLVNSAAHGPADDVQAVLSMAEDLAHGHAHDLDTSGAGAHNAIDHDHQAMALLPPPAEVVRETAMVALFNIPALDSGLARDGPRRPPRLSA